jgi:GYF domain 2
VIDGTATPAKVYIGEASSVASGNPPNEFGGEASPAAASPGGPGFGGAGIGGRGFSDPAPVISDPVGPAADEYAVDIADNDQRNMTIHQIVGAYNEGLVTADTYIWKEGMPDWQTLAEVREVASALHAAARPMAAAVRRPEHGGSKDLFGSIDTAGGEDDITTSAPEPPPGFTAGTGARNESSVLFSLSALTGSAESTTTASGGQKRGRGTSDDSGLIDLQALTAAEAAGGGGFGGSAGGYGASPLIGAPLGGVSGPAMGASLASGYGRRSGSRLGLIIGAVALAGVIIVGAAFVVNKGGADPEPTSALEKAGSADKVAAAAAEKGSEPKEAEPIGAEPEPKKPEAAEHGLSAKELPTAPPEPTARPATPKAPVRPRPPPRAKPQAAVAPPPPEPEPVAAPKPVPAAEAAAAAEKKKKPAQRCECSPSDLMCAMRCSAKKK